MNARDLNHCTPHGDSDGGGRKEGAVAGGPAGADARRGRRESGGAASVVVAIVFSVGRKIVYFERYKFNKLGKACLLLNPLASLRTGEII